MNPQTTTTTEAPTTTAPKDDFVLATETQSKNAEPTETETQPGKTAASETAPTEEEVEIEEPEEGEPEVDASKKTDEPGKKKKGGFQRRVDKLTREKEDLRRDNEQLRADMAAQKAARDSGKVTEPTKTTTDSKEPKSDDFEKVEDYYKAVAKHEAKLELQNEMKAQAAKQREDAAKAELANKQNAHRSRITDFEKTHADFKDVMEEIGEIAAPREMFDAILESDFGPAIMYELAQDPESYAKLAAAGPIHAVKAVAKIEARLEAASSAAKDKTAPAAPAKKVSSAPPPINPITSKVSGHAPTIRDDLPYEEWVKVRNAGLRDR